MIGIVAKYKDVLVLKWQQIEQEVELKSIWAEYVSSKTSKKWAHKIINRRQRTIRRRQDLSGV